MILFRKYYCKLCGFKIRNYVYIPKHSKRKAKIVICKKCQLVQSVFRKSNFKKKASLSSDADWGNVRHGKKLRLDKQTENINFDLYLKGKVLDIGSNRGDFIKFALKNKNVEEVYALEPDLNLIDYFDEDKTKIINDRIENINFNKTIKFDFIYCSHTLEHLDEFESLFNLFNNNLAESGKILIDVPNITFIENKNLTEEFFIDKHKFHFSISSLENLISRYNYQNHYSHYENNNLIYIIKKSEDQISNVKSNVRLSTIDYKNLIRNYKHNLRNNRRKLTKIVKSEFLDTINNKRVVIWGAGRILNSLLKYGNLKLNNNVMLVDSYLTNLPNDIVQEYYLNKVQLPKEIESYNPEVIFILANSAESEINKILKSSFNKKVVLWNEIMKKY